MIYTGIDMTEISRIKSSLQKDTFKKRVYGVNELSELEKRGFPAQSAAAAFAAKEAFSKALGTGICGFSLSEVEVLHEKNGKPYLSLSGKAKIIADEKGLEFALSITHTELYATAIVIAYRENKQGAD